MSSVPSDRHISERAIMALVHYGGVNSRPPLLSQQSSNVQQTPSRNQVGGLMSPIPMGNQQLAQSGVMRSHSGCKYNLVFSKVAFSLITSFLVPVISTPMQGYQSTPPVTPVQYSASPINTTISGTSVLPSASSKFINVFQLFL